MARRKRRSGGLGAVARSGSQFRGKNLRHTAKFCVTVHRNIGASTSGQYVANAEPCGPYPVIGRGRYTSAVGRTPTSATKKALKRLAVKLK